MSTRQKVILIGGIIAIMLVIAIFLGAFRINEANNIITKEKATELGIMFLKDNFPNGFSDWEAIVFEAIEYEDRWRVHNVVEQNVQIYKNGAQGYSVGGILYVEFSKETGEFMRAGVDD